MRLLTLLALVLGNLVQGVDGYKHHIIVLVDDLYLLLISVTLRYTHQSAELAHAVVHVNHVISNLELLQLLERKRHLSVAGTLAAKIIFVIAVKYLVVGKEAALKNTVGKSLMQCLADGLKLYVLAALGKNIVQALALLGVIGKDIDPVTLYYIIGQRL